MKTNPFLPFPFACCLLPLLHVCLHAAAQRAGGEMLSVARCRVEVTCRWLAPTLADVDVWYGASLTVWHSAGLDTACHVCDSVSASLSAQPCGSKPARWSPFIQSVRWDAVTFKVARPRHPLPCGSSFMEMAEVKGGSFTMGCTSEQGSEFDGRSSGCDSDEKPAHTVTLSDFCIGTREVTQAQWEQVMGYNPSHRRGASLPVENLTWDEAQEFAKALSEKTKQRYRLPTEAEWEYAARGGSESKGFRYSGSNLLDEVAWYSLNSGDTTHEAGAKRPNELGIYDMSGNVWEWCSDWHGAAYYATEDSRKENPKGPSSGQRRVVRGGSWGYGEESARVSYRNGHVPGSPDRHIGLRLVLTP